MLTESQVIAATCRFLKKKGFKITRFLSETEHGVDIEAAAPDGETKVSIRNQFEGNDGSFRKTVWLEASVRSRLESFLLRR